MIVALQEKDTLIGLLDKHEDQLRHACSKEVEEVTARLTRQFNLKLSRDSQQIQELRADMKSLHLVCSVLCLTCC